MSLANRRPLELTDMSVTDVTAALESAQTQTGQSLAALSRHGPVLLVFLRHSGCTFCRQALADLSTNRAALSAAGVTIAIAHMQTDVDAAKLFAQYGLDDVPRLADPERRLYQALEVPEGSLLQVVGPGVWAGGLKALLTGHLPGVPSADVFQLPGAFLLRDGKIARAFRGRNSADRPDYCDLAGISTR